MPLLQEWGVPLSVLAMLLAASFMAGLMSRYQAHQAGVGAAVRRLELGLATISAALGALGKVPLSRELRATLRGEIHARYQRIRHLYPRYPGIRAKIQAAERAFEAPGSWVSISVCMTSALA